MSFGKAREGWGEVRWGRAEEEKRPSYGKFWALIRLMKLILLYRRSR